MRPPATPDLPGNPISKSHSPERSYSPLAARTASVSRATSAETTSFPCHRVHASVSECRRHNCQVAGVDRDGALPGVHIDGLHRVADDPPIALEQAGDRVVALIGRSLRPVDDVIDLERPARESRQSGEDAGPPLFGCRAGHQRRRGDRASIHHWIHRMAVVELDGHHGVEGEAGVVHSDDVQGALVAELLAHEGIDERLRDRLDGEPRPSVAKLMEPAGDVYDAQPKSLRIGLREDRDVVGHRTLMMGFRPPERGREQCIDGRTRRQSTGAHCLRNPVDVQIHCAPVQRAPLRTPSEPI